ncbi:MAG: asparagine synthase-related protein, partial [Pseudomonadota bacterium]
DSFHWSGDVDLQRLLPGRDARGISAAKYRRFLEPYGDQVQDALQATQLIHFHGRLGAYEFRQMDTISMAHSVEARSPLVDRALIAAAFNFDPALKQMGGEKGIFKQSLRGLVPDEIIDRKKAGFPIPEEIWFSRPFEDRAQILFEPGSQVVASGVVDADYMKATWERRDVNHRNIFSRLYTLENILRRQAPELAPRPDAGPAPDLPMRPKNSG